eukprot:4068603-Amphidinium_carterae.1
MPLDAVFELDPASHVPDEDDLPLDVLFELVPGEHTQLVVRSAPAGLPWMTSNLRLMWYKRTCHIAARYRFGSQTQLAQVDAAASGKRAAYVAAYHALQMLERGEIAMNHWQAKVREMLAA